MNEKVFLKLALVIWDYKRHHGDLSTLKEAIQTAFINPDAEVKTATSIWACIDDVDGINPRLLEDVARTRGLDLDKLQCWRDAKEHAEKRTLVPQEVEA